VGMTQWGLDTLFNPAKRHMDEEKLRLQSTREEVSDSSGGRRIDLESGKVTIQRKRAKPTDEDATAEADAVAASDDAATDDAATDDAATDDAATDDAATDDAAIDSDATDEADEDEPRTEVDSD
jgi:hypothetical protein